MKKRVLVDNEAVKRIFKKVSLEFSVALASTEFLKKLSLECLNGSFYAFSVKVS